MATPAAAATLLRSRSYWVLLAVAALIGIPISALAYFFLDLVSRLQRWTFTSLPGALGFHGEPLWWPAPPLLIAGLLVALTIRYLPGTAGHSPADGLSTKGAPGPAELPGVILAALATLALGAVLGPEAPLIALGGGLAICVIRLSRRDEPAAVAGMVAAAGSFAAISALFGSPLLGAFLLMEAVGLGGLSLELVLLPGLLAAGVGSLVFIGLGHWTGLGTFSLRIGNLPHVGSPRAGEFGWAIVIGVAAALLGTGIRRLALRARTVVDRRRLLVTPAAGLVVAGLAIAYAAGTGRSSADVLFSGQSALPHLVGHAAGYSVGALLLLLACKSLAYGVSMSGFRGGPVFPSLFIGAAGGIALSHLPGLGMIAGMAMGIGAMCAVMLRLPLTSVLLATLLLYSDGVAVMPLVIVAVVVAYVLSARFAEDPPAADVPPPGPGPAKSSFATVAEHPVRAS
ncbi:MAG TPA: chloride channel protein [Streptosporangiaceae bacterium]|nr:chloride channel protein [Streptosporangiaceae bacterium]